MRVYKQDVFGPVLVVLTAPSLEETTRLVNRNEYGNGVAISTNSGPKASWFPKNIEAGQVGINVPIPVPLPMLSFI